MKNPEVKRKELLSLHNMMWLNILTVLMLTYYALTRMPEKIPALFKDYMLSTVSFLSPCRPTDGNDRESGLFFPKNVLKSYRQK